MNTYLFVTIIILVIFGGIGGAIWMQREADIQPVAIPWESLLTDMRTVVAIEFPEVELQENYPLEIIKTADITGDQVPEALVNLGSVGVYTHAVTLMMQREGKVEAALFKSDILPTVSESFLMGASARNGSMVELIPETHVLYSADWSLGETGEVEICNVNAYQWNAQEGSFVASKEVSEQLTRTVCQGIGTASLPR